MTPSTARQENGHKPGEAERHDTKPGEAGTHDTKPGEAGKHDTKPGEAGEHDTSPARQDIMTKARRGGRRNKTEPDPTS